MNQAVAVWQLYISVSRCNRPTEYYWRTCSYLSASQTSVRKNMADFHVC
jgi:hypothetical protein